MTANEAIEDFIIFDLSSVVCFKYNIFVIADSKLTVNLYKKHHSVTVRTSDS